MTYHCSTFCEAQEDSADNKACHVMQKCRTYGDDAESDDQESQPCRPIALEKQVGWNVGNDILEGELMSVVDQRFQRSHDLHRRRTP